MIGVTIGDYEITRRLGSGGVGDVYLATDLMLERDIAIKFLRPGLGTQGEVAARFRSEARTLAQLHHPNIAMIYSLHREDDNFAMIMEYVDGMTFAELLLQHGALPLELALPIFFQALDGVGCAHEHGVVHRDLKASNLMLARSGIVKVMDFGIARCLGTGRMTRAGNVVGTAHYMAPEQVQGRDTDLRADIYALALVLYELLTDHLPFEDLSEYEVMRAQIEQTPRPPRTFNPDLPEKVEAAILCGLEKDPEYRFQSTAEFREALDGVIPDDELISDALDLGSLVGSRPADTTSMDPKLAQAETVIDLSRVGGGSETLLLVEEEPGDGRESPVVDEIAGEDFDEEEDGGEALPRAEVTPAAKSARSRSRRRFGFLVPAAMTGLIALSVGAPVPAPHQRHAPTAPPGTAFARTPLRSASPPVRVLDLEPDRLTMAPLRADADRREIASLAERFFAPVRDGSPALASTGGAGTASGTRATEAQPAPTPSAAPRARAKTTAKRRPARKPRPKPADTQERPATFERPSAGDATDGGSERDTWVIRTK